MRVLAFVLSVVLVTGAARAQQGLLPYTQGPCVYTIAGKSYTVPIGGKICFRSPPPYGEQYALEQCFPPLSEVDLVKRGDPRCERYEIRQ